jgi:hypothetical protein
MYATYNTQLHTLRKSTESGAVWIWYPAILLLKLCRWVLLCAKHAWSKADHLTSILCRDWQCIELRTLVTFPFIAISTINHIQFTINTSYHYALKYSNRLSAMCRVWSFYTCYTNTNLISITWNKTDVLDSTDKCCICIHTILIFRNEVHIFMVLRKSFLFSSLSPWAQTFDGSILLP